jgi:hypothetical protein
MILLFDEAVEARQAERVALWRERQKARCARWTAGRQCHHYRLTDSRYCAMHSKPRAERTAAWPTGPVACCDEHGRQLVGLGDFLGTHIVATVLTEPAECVNCVNEGPLDG